MSAPQTMSSINAPVPQPAAASLRPDGAADTPPCARDCAPPAHGNARRSAQGRCPARRESARGWREPLQRPGRSTSCVSHQFCRSANARRFIARFAAHALDYGQALEIGDVLAIPSTQVGYAIERGAGFKLDTRFHAALVARIEATPCCGGGRTGSSEPKQVHRKRLSTKALRRHQCCGPTR